MTRRQTGLFALSGAGFLCGLAFALVWRTAPTLFSPLAFGLLGMALLLLGCAASLPVWARLDEVSREAHKTAWTHGALFGMAPVVGVMAWAARSGHDLPVGLVSLGPAPAGLIVFGVVLTFGCQVAGYLLVWAGWWLSKR